MTTIRRLTPDELSLQDARIDGAAAGRRGTAAALNPYDHETEEYAEWDKHRRLALVQSLVGLDA